MPWYVNRAGVAFPELPGAEKSAEAGNRVPPLQIVAGELRCREFTTALLERTSIRRQRQKDRLYNILLGLATGISGMLIVFASLGIESLPLPVRMCGLAAGFGVWFILPRYLEAGR